MGQLMLLPIPVGDYQFNSPALLYEGRLSVFGDAHCWESATVWAAHLEKLEPPPEAVIIPLELASPSACRQDLLGYELLSALRWSGSEALRGIPCLLGSWQPLNNLLQKGSDLLLVKPAAEFVRLPDALLRLPQFLRDVAEARILPASSDSIIEACSMGNLAARRVSYHELANDYYAAYRMKKGYIALLREAKKARVFGADNELKAMSEFRYAWEPALESKLMSPLVRKFQASRSGVYAPRYPVIDESEEILAHHLQQGLPHGTRILLVDDEFHKGSAEVLLRILFRQYHFTMQLNNEWVYSESSESDPSDRWARFVCVRSAELARNWLAYLDGIAIEDTTQQHSWKEWLAGWYQALSPSAKKRGHSLDPVDVFSENREFVLDRRSAGPRVKSTIVLLDLRLDPPREALYSIKDLSSYALRRAIKSEKPELPVIMFTASRQLLNFAELLDSSSEVDGWFVKEGPDIPVDREDINSANAVAYLLERLHLYSTLRGWYRPSFDWTLDRKLAYAKLFHSKQAAAVFADIAQLSSTLFQQIIERNWGGEHSDTDTYWVFIQKRVPPTPFPLCQTLVARRVALAALFWTADMTPSGPEWNADSFVRLLPGRPTKKIVKWVYDKLNFNQVLWMRSSGIPSQLLQEEIEWLQKVEWPAEKKASILDALHRELLDNPS